MMYRRMMVIGWAVVLTVSCGVSADERPNGFDLSEVSIPVKEILDGGVGKDGIPAIDHPKFLPADDVDFIKDGETVISFTGKSGQTKAYPIRILMQHEIVNDQFGEQAIMVTYCPLCASAMVFERAIEGKKLTFGVSGLLYQSDVLMYDRETQSLWTQLGMRSVSGPNVGKKLQWLASEQLSFSEWKKKYPQGKVLSTDTGFMRNYERSGYAMYFESSETVFPAPYTRKELAKKSYVSGVFYKGQAMAFPIRAMPKGKLIEVEIGGEKVKVIFEPGMRQMKAYEADGVTPVPVVKAFWFAWQAFYPETKIWQP